MGAVWTVDALCDPPSAGCLVSGVPEPPHVRFGQTDPHAEYALRGYLTDLNLMARTLTFLNADGAITSGTRSLNIDGVWVRYTSNAVADTEDTVSHNLLRIPVGFYQGIPSKAGMAYVSSTAATSTTIYLKANVGTLTVNLFLF